MTPLHAQARALAEAGFKIFPCQENGKLPATAHGFRDACSDLSQIDAWWSENPNFNIGMSPEDAGLAVIDIDPGGQPGWIALLSQHGQHEQTYTVETPRGGWHITFAGSIPSSVSKLAPHVDTRGRGGYVLVPPSIVNGKRYRVLHDNPIAVLPPWINKALGEASHEVKRAEPVELDTAANLSRARGYLRDCKLRGSVAISGAGGNDRTYRLFSELRDYGISIETALELVLAQDGWNDACQPPWSAEELETIAKNAYTYAQNSAGVWGVGDLNDTFRNALAAQPVKPSKFTALTYEEGLQLPEPRWLVPGVLPANSYVVIYGERSSYKSFIALDIALRHAMKGEGMVFYAALEGLHGIRRSRSQAWVAANTTNVVEQVGNSDPNRPTLVRRDVVPNLSSWRTMAGPRVGLDTEVQEFGECIKEAAGNRKVDLIVIDTFGRAMDGLNENFAQDVSRFCRSVESLIEAFGCTVMAVHHSVRGGERERGSTAILANADAALQVIRKGDAVEVWVRKQKDAEERATPLTYRRRAMRGSLVFVPTTEAEHREAAAEADPYSPHNVGVALAGAGAHNFPTAISTADLLVKLDREGLGDERAVRALEKLGKTRLRAYCENVDGVLWWYCNRPEG